MPAKPESPRPETLLGGRVQYRQSAHGYRTGIEPVLLAAAVPAQPGARVIEAGTGAGAALLCLAARIPSLTGLGLDQNADLTARARDNASLNGFHHRLTFHTTAIEAYAAPDRFDHALANPPWHAPSGTGSPNPGRAEAKRAHPSLLADWVHALARCLRSRGTISLILPAAQLDQAILALTAAGFGSLRLLPLWPRAGTPARLLILQAVRHGKGATSLAPGLVLHTAGSSFTEAANRILRDGAAF